MGNKNEIEMERIYNLTNGLKFGFFKQCSNMYSIELTDKSGSANAFSDSRLYAVGAQKFVFKTLAQAGGLIVWNFQK